MNWNELINNVLQTLLTIIVALIPVVVPLILNRLFDKWGAVADQARREAVITAIVNGLIAAADKRGIKKGDSITDEVKEAVAAEAAFYAGTTVPESIKKLEIPTINLVNIAKTRLPQILGSFGPVGVVVGTVTGEVVDQMDGQAKH